jgi:predicted nucleotidyltransferase
MSVGESVYARRRWPLLARLRSALRTERNVCFAMLFGSAARGEDAEGSDIDVIVSLRDPSFARLSDLRLNLEEALGRTVDVVPLEEAEEAPTFLAMALKDGRVLAEFFARYRAWIELYLD